MVPALGDAWIANATKQRLGVLLKPFGCSGEIMPHRHLSAELNIHRLKDVLLPGRTSKNPI